MTEKILINQFHQSSFLEVSNQSINISTGQLHEIAENMYNIELEIEVLEKKISKGSFKINTLVLRLNYNNCDYMMNKEKQVCTVDRFADDFR